MVISNAPVITAFNKLRHKTTDREKRVKKAYASVERQLERANSKEEETGKNKKRKREEKRAKKKKAKKSRRRNSSTSE